jgi:rhodanese-related sulfurtransferase
MSATLTEMLKKRSSHRRARRFFQARLQFTLGPYDLDEMLKRGDSVNIIDVRKSEDFVREHISGAVNLPEIRWSTFTGLRKDRINVVYCHNPTCLLSARAAMYFAEHDFPVMELLGGIGTWKESGLSTEPSKE